MTASQSEAEILAEDVRSAVQRLVEERLGQVGEHDEAVVAILLGALAAVVGAFVVHAPAASRDDFLNELGSTVRDFVDQVWSASEESCH